MIKDYLMSVERKYKYWGAPQRWDDLVMANESKKR